MSGNDDDDNLRLVRHEAQFIWLENAEVSSAFFRTENVDYDGRFIPTLKIN